MDGLLAGQQLHPQAEGYTFPLHSSTYALSVGYAGYLQ
jgi:hypothetical protein